MDFSISREQEDLLSKLDTFCQKHLSEEIVNRWIAEGRVPDSFTRKYLEEGFGRIGLPKRLGGIPAPVITKALILERLALRAGATLPAQGLMTDMHFISKAASEDQATLLQKTIENTGRLPFSLAVSEPQSGSETFDVRTTASESESGFVINGTKSFVNSGQFAPYIALIAYDVDMDTPPHNDKAPLTFFLVSRDAEGVDTFPMAKIGQKLIPTADIVFDNVQVEKSAVIGIRGHGAEMLLSSFEYGRIYVCATTVGLAQSALEQAVMYALDRKISNSSILAFQQIQEMITDAQAKIDAMRSLLYKTACGIDEQSKYSRLDTAILKRFIPKTAMEVADSAMQIMGGMGYQSTTKAARIWEECRGNRIIQGTDEIMTIVAAKRIAQRLVDEQVNPPIWRF